MKVIITNILSLIDYKRIMNDRGIKTDQCPSCYKAHTLHRHAYYCRKSDRQAKPGESLNPIKIIRFICNHCRKTCSVLPECIPPRRWYLWDTQQAVIQECLAGKSLRSISKRFAVARSTCRRWYQSLEARFLIHVDVLRNSAGKLSEALAHCFDFKSFWQSCFAQISFSRAMLLCHRAGLDVP
jgi:hypothetical protein